ncbi:MAG TPA: ATP-binding cassette domain-containing protein [Tenuifilaceae bacterium]|nr:ATP-binding cassette domain-containing protein [Tenuifilaceae bacterium]HOZ15159.1 ATP-binding cassette domain-containing protein [Tenuifilaceae bacterium]HPI44981.1 ATP-binding cassette domain-containing protein [Tenuifilaceae bacterium]HPN21337.1 ATP-binding cassette domain-containing protein [Tenuifilaceae bacterium]
MITLNHVSKSFEGREVLSDISAVFEKGKTNLIIGQSGSGKTVLLKSIVGLHDINEGEIYFNDILFNKLNFSGKKEIRKKMGMLFQGSALFDSSTVEENVMFPLDMFTDMTKEEKLDRVNFCLNRVNIINSNHLFPAEISGGMKKRVAIARAIALNPEFLFCDEPNSGLDPRTSVVIDELIKEITVEYNITTIVNTHDMNSVMSMGDKVIYIYEGKKWWEGTSAEILDSDNKELNDFVFSSELTRKIKGL